MRDFLQKIVVFTLLIALGFLGWRVADLKREAGLLRETVTELEAERRKLATQLAGAQKAPPPAEQKRLRGEVERQTSELRGLKFLKPVTYKEIARDQLAKILVEKVHEIYTPQEIHDYGRSLATLGLVPEGTDLLAAILALYGEQVAAFYVPEERALYTFTESGWTGADRMLLSHELTHALQDQTFDLTTFPLKLKDNDDRVLAAAALVEGDATVLMTRWYADHADPTNILNDLGSMLGQDTATLMNAPLYLRETLLFPYVQGQQFAMAVFGAGGTAGLDKAFRSLPVSSEQILHPEKFLKQRDDPQSVEVAKIEANGWRLIGNNVLGEFGVKILFENSLGATRAEAAANGWDGDRYHVYERGPTGPTALVWRTVWDSEQDAIEFAEAYDAFINKRRAEKPVTTRVKRDGVWVTIEQSADQGFLALVPAR